MSRILLCGAFGQDNPGDEALQTAFLDALSGHDIVVASSTDVDQPRTAAVSPDLLGVGRVFRHVDAVVIAGGTIFKSLHPSASRHPVGLLGKTATMLAGARLAGVPLTMVGVGAGDLRSRTAVRLAAWIADHADLLVLRDEESASVLADVGATQPFRVGADPTWTLFDGVAPGNESRDDVVLALSHLADTDVDRLVGRLAHLVEPLLASGVPVRVQPWQGDDGIDSLVAHGLLRRLGRSPLVRLAPRPQSLDDAVQSFRSARAVISLRHHGLVAAAVAGCPFLAVSHEPKLSGLARRLGQASVPPHATPAVLARSALGVLSSDAPSSAAIEGEMAAAARTMRLLRVVVSRGADEELVDRDQLELTAGGTPW